ncbi:hypothetical protein [Nonomuraea indica]|uniref:hypothetical protein n=1 Tax=Nonomuraea indica TaxID=1581193 RepID=UPI0015DFBDF9|nr:hypothetical protein [Nonomuraea indica]
MEGVRQISKLKLTKPPGQVVAAARSVGWTVINWVPFSGDIDVNVGGGGLGQSPTNTHPEITEGGALLRCAGYSYGVRHTCL